METVNERLDQIVEEFVDLDGREKLELLLDFANRLPPLSDEYTAKKNTEDRRVHECQTSVFLWPEISNGSMNLVAEVAEEAPTVKGFVAILAEAVASRPQPEAQELPEDLLEKMGLADVLGTLRSRGLRAIVSRVRQELINAK
ncbi:MAG: SufE family protein [Planctomycetaceae bacterium]|nr:SufE family protein [Planctomycetaceae bacterium]